MRMFYPTSQATNHSTEIVKDSRVPVTLLTGYNGVFELRKQKRQGAV